MERPTCGTCPYWKFEDDAYGEELMAVGKEIYAAQGETFVNPGFGFCRRFPPAYVVPLDKRPESDNFDADDWPGTHEFDWCGEHPDFPAYLASLKTEPAATS